MELTEFAGLGAIPFCVALTQVCKAWITDPRWWPVISIAWGVLISSGVARALGTDMVLAVLLGVVAGLTASGGWSGAKAAQGL